MMGEWEQMMALILLGRMGKDVNFLHFEKLIFVIDSASLISSEVKGLSEQSTSVTEVRSFKKSRF